MSLSLTDAPGQSRTVPRLLIGLAFALTALFVVAPLAFIFWRAFAEGWAVYLGNITDPLTRHAIWLTTLVAVIVVPVPAESTPSSPPRVSARRRIEVRPTPGTAAPTPAPSSATVMSSASSGALRVTWTRRATACRAA